MGLLSGWTYRKEIVIDQTDDIGAVNYQLKLLVGESSGATGEEVDCGGHVAADFDDLRFTSSDGTTLLDYWIESISGATPNCLATVWIEVPLLDDAADTTIYMYYGGTETAVSNGANTFIFFDDFERGSNGDAIGGSWTNSSGDADISTDHAYGGSKSAIIKGHASGTVVYASTTVDDNMALRFRLWKETANISTGVYVIDSGTGDYCNVVIDPEEDITYYDGDVHDTGSNITADQWELIELNDFSWSGGTFDIWHNGSEIKANAQQALSDQVADVIQFYNADTTAGRDFYVDDVIVRKFTPNEPTWKTFGSEEQHIFARTAEVKVGVTQTASRSLTTSRQADCMVGVKQTATRQFTTTRTASMLIGVKTLATKLLSLARTAACKVGLVTTATHTETLTYMTILKGQYGSPSIPVNRLVVYGRAVDDTHTIGGDESSTEQTAVGSWFMPEYEPAAVTNALALSIAQAKEAKRRLNVSKGFILSFVHTGLELWDVIQLTDSRGNQSAATYRVIGLKTKSSTLKSGAEWYQIIELGAV